MARGDLDTTLLADFEPQRVGLLGLLAQFGEADSVGEVGMGVPLGVGKAPLVAVGVGGGLRRAAKGSGEILRAAEELYGKL